MNKKPSKRIEEIMKDKEWFSPEAGIDAIVQYLDETYSEKTDTISRSSVQEMLEGMLKESYKNGTGDGYLATQVLKEVLSNLKEI